MLCFFSLGIAQMQTHDTPPRRRPNLPPNPTPPPSQKKIPLIFCKQFSFLFSQNCSIGVRLFSFLTGGHSFMKTTVDRKTKKSTNMLDEIRVAHDSSLFRRALAEAAAINCHELDSFLGFVLLCCLKKKRSHREQRHRQASRARCQSCRCIE